MNILKLIKALKTYLPLLLIFITLSQCHFYKKERNKVKDFKQLHKVQQQELETWRDKAGKNRARAETAEINASNAKHVLSEELKSLIKKEVGSIKRNLISYASVKASTKGRIKASTVDTIYVIDSLKQLPAKQFNINNPDLEFKGHYIPSLDSLIADYKVQHNFEVFHYYKKKGKAPWNLFRRKRAVAEIKFENHGSQADSLFTIILKRKKGLIKRVLGRN